jgi:hypothetical protein
MLLVVLPLEFKNLRIYLPFIFRSIEVYESACAIEFIVEKCPFVNVPVGKMILALNLFSNFFSFCFCVPFRLLDC